MVVTHASDSFTYRAVGRCSSIYNCTPCPGRSSAIRPASRVATRYCRCCRCSGPAATRLAAGLAVPSAVCNCHLKSQSQVITMLLLHGGSAWYYFATILVIIIIQWLFEHLNARVTVVRQKLEIAFASSRIRTV